VIIPGVVPEGDAFIERRVQQGNGVVDFELADVPTADAEDGDVDTGVAERAGDRRIIVNWLLKTKPISVEP